jgi:LacI family transcriptional regulator
MRLGYTLVLHPLRASEEAERDFAERVMPSLPIDGLVLVMPEGMFPYVGDLARHGLPVVVIDDRREIEEFPSVLAANRDGAKAATAHLLQAGCRRVACVMGPLKHLYARERLEGYRAALGEANVAYRHELVVSDEDEEPRAAEALSTLMSRRVDFDALFACHDEMAAELLGALRAAGLSVPGDVAVVGFDDIPPARFMYPALTTVRQPLYEMGTAAVRMLHDAIEHRSRPKSVVLPTELVVRESCGAAEARAERETRQ